MDVAVPVEDNQVVTPGDSQVVQTQQQVPTVDLSGVVDGIKKTNDDVNDVGAKLTDGINGVAGQVDELSRTTDDLVSEVRASNERNEQQQTTTMLVDDAQWTELQHAWWQARDTFAAAFFLEIVIALLLASMLGAKLWGFFSKGWRR